MDENGPGLIRVLIGGSLLTVGLLVLLGQVIDGVWDYAWPIFVIVPGVLLLAAGLTAQGREDASLAGCGGVIAALGLLLFYQNATGHWESWAYAWALVGPGAAGAALAARAELEGDETAAARATICWRAGVGLFAAGVALFEGMLGISGRDLGPVGDAIFPALLVGAGLWVLVRRPDRPAG